MSRSALVIFFANSLKAYANMFLFVLLLNIFSSARQRSLAKTVIAVLATVGLCLLLAAVTALGKYFFRKYYIDGGNLIFIHGFLQKETTSIPLDKIHTLRTKRGPIYRLLDMRGVSFDTLASKSSEIELILDESDWKMLFERVESQEQVLQETPQTPREETIRPGNLSLIRGALCQNHLQGMAILSGFLYTIYSQVPALQDRAASYAAELVTHLPSLSTTLTVLAALYLTILLLWIGKVFIRYYGMEIRISDNLLTFESGLFSRNSSRFSYDKICTVYVKQNILEKWFRCSSVSLIQAFNATDEKKGSDVRIYGSTDAPRLLDWWLGSGYASSAVTASARCGYGLFLHTVRTDLLIIAAAVAAICIYAPPAWLLLPALYLPAAIAKGLLAVRRGRIILREDYLEIHDGRLADKRHYIKYSSIEAVRLDSTPFTPISGRRILRISTNGTSFAVRSLDGHQAGLVRELLLAMSENSGVRTTCSRLPY